jgi:hypothetical protein
MVMLSGKLPASATRHWHCTRMLLIAGMGAGFGFFSMAARAYPPASRDQFQFISDLTIRGKAALADLGVKPARAVSVSAPHN